MGDEPKYVSRVDAIHDGLVPPVAPPPARAIPYSPASDPGSSRLTTEVSQRIAHAHDEREVVEQVLLPGERILWVGRPDPDVIFTAADGFLLPVHLLWTGFVVFFLVTVWADGINSGGAFVVVPGIFVLVGSYLVVGRFIVKAAMKRRTVYGITDRRALIISGTSMTEAPISGTQRATKWARNRRHMTTTFGQPWSFSVFGSRNYFPNTGLDFFAFGTPRPTAFYDVADVDGLTAALAATSAAA